MLLPRGHLKPVLRLLRARARRQACANGRAAAAARAPGQETGALATVPSRHAPLAAYGLEEALQAVLVIATLRLRAGFEGAVQQVAAQRDAVRRSSRRSRTQRGARTAPACSRTLRRTGRTCGQPRSAISGLAGHPPPSPPRAAAARRASQQRLTPRVRRRKRRAHTRRTRRTRGVERRRGGEKR